MGSIFDILGPVMVGPSSSHTAGAARIGYTARQLFGEPVKKAEVYLHGSFAATGKGHGTDRAIIAGLLVEEIGKCPRCGSPVYVGKGNFYCSNKECSFCLWEDNKFFSSKKKKLTKKIAKELLDKGWCRVTGLYTPKKPQLYDAVIRLDDSGGKYVSFKMEFDK